MKTITIIAVAAVSALAVAVPNAAAREKFDTDVQFLGSFNGDPSGITYFGRVISDKGACEGKRKFQVFSPSGRKRRGTPIDSGVSSKHGAWAAHVLNEDLGDTLVIDVAKAKRGGDTCRAVTDATGT